MQVEVCRSCSAFWATTATSPSCVKKRSCLHVSAPPDTGPDTNINIDHELQHVPAGGDVLELLLGQPRLLCPRLS